jgi:hypothetical protein
MRNESHKQALNTVGILARSFGPCKVWLVPVALSSGLGFSARELREIERLVSLNRAILLKAWEEFHG